MAITNAEMAEAMVIMCFGSDNGLSHTISVVGLAYCDRLPQFGEVRQQKPSLDKLPALRSVTADNLLTNWL